MVVHYESERGTEMTLVHEIMVIEYKKVTGKEDYVAEFKGNEIRLIANLSTDGIRVLSYTASVNNRLLRTGSSKDAKIFAGLELLDILNK